MTLGIIGGTSLLFSRLPPLEKRRVATPYGSADLLCGDFIMLMRHQDGIPPHRINHRAGLSALAIAGVDRIVAFGSSGSLKPEIPPGSIVIPTDYISAADIPSIHDHGIVHVSPKMPAGLAETLARIIPGARHGGVYIQTRGPRFETAAEIKSFAPVADIVGMTLASEATLASELTMEFSAVCTVDNFANGIASLEVTYEQLLETSKLNRERTDEIMNAIITHMA